MNPQNNPARIRAKRVLNHYFSILLRAADLRQSNDNRAELDNLVDDIIDAAVDQMKSSVPEEEQAGKGYAEYFYGVKPTLPTSSA